MTTEGESTEHNLTKTGTSDNLRDYMSVDRATAQVVLRNSSTLKQADTRFLVCLHWWCLSFSRSVQTFSDVTSRDAVRFVFPVM
jgi:hypothetical protein